LLAQGSSSKDAPDFPRIRTRLGVTIASGKMATFHPLFPARRHASDANRMALTRSCLLTAKPSCWSRVGDDTPRHAAEISPAEIPSVLRTAGLERSITCFRSTCAKNVSRGSVAALMPANRRRYSRSATSSVSEKYRQSTSRGLQRPGRPDVWRYLGGLPSRKSSAADTPDQSPSHRPCWNSLKELRELAPCGERQLGLPVSMSSTRSATRAIFPFRITSKGVWPSSSSFARWSHLRKSL
jgi:hypothetical protein